MLKPITFGVKKNDNKENSTKNRHFQMVLFELFLFSASAHTTLAGTSVTIGIGLTGKADCGLYFNLLDRKEQLDA
ncbi:MAG: hypothetical protein KKA84_11955 [Bacteroidetes bacterium]|nr:hypothetical protein [Bacteroidota bacterium]